MSVKLGAVTMSDDPSAASAVKRLEREAYLSAANIAEQAGDLASAAKFRTLALKLIDTAGGELGAVSVVDDAERRRNLRYLPPVEEGPVITIKPVPFQVAPRRPEGSLQTIPFKDRNLQVTTPAMKSRKPEDFFWALKNNTTPIKDALYGSKCSGLRLGSPKAGGARLGYPVDSEIEASLVAKLATGADPYDVFVQFVIDNAPDYLKPGGPNAWTLDAYQVNEALRSFERNYSLYQDAKDAAAFGLRFPDDLRADIAFKRLKLAEKQWDDIFLGFYTPVTMAYAPSLDPAVMGILPQLGPRPTILVDLSVHEITYIQTLTGTSQTLGYWYMHVYRMLQYFVPILAKFVASGGVPTSEVITLFEIPNLDNSERFVSWAAASSYFMFARFNADKEFRGMADDAQLADLQVGTTLAGFYNNAEIALMQIIGQSIQKEIQYLQQIEWLLKVAKIPLDKIVGAAAGALELAGSLSWWEIGLMAIGGLVLTGVVVSIVRP